MGKKETFSKDTLFKSFIPLIAGFICFLLHTIMEKISYFSSYQTIPVFVLSNNTRIGTTFEILKETCLGVYSNFSTFLITMLALHFLFKLLDIILNHIKSSFSVKQSNNKPSQKRTFEDDSSSIIPGTIKNLCEALVFYTVGFCICNILILSSSLFLFYVLHGASPSQPNPIILSQPQILQVHNVLPNTSHEVSFKPDDSQSRMLVSKKPALAEILDAVDISVTSVLFSPKQDIVYALHESEIAIFNISNSDSLDMISTISLGQARLRCGLALSSGGTTLFVANVQNLHIINVTNPATPVLLSHFHNPTYEESTFSLYGRTVTLTADDKTLIASGWGYILYNVSNVTVPSILKFSEKNIYTHATSHNDQILYLVQSEEKTDTDTDTTNSAAKNTFFHVYDISNKSSPSLLAELPAGSLNSLKLSSDKQTAYIIACEFPGLSPPTSDLLIFSVKDPVPVLINKVFLAKDTFKIFSLSHNDSFLYYGDSITFQGFNLKTLQPLQSIPSSLNPTSLFLPNFDSRIALAATKTQLIVYRLLLGLRNFIIFSPKEFTIGSFSHKDNSASKPMMLSNDGKTVFQISIRDQKIEYFQIIDVSIETNPVLISETLLPETIFQIELSSDEKLAFLRTHDKIQIYDISNFKDPKKTSSLDLDGSRLYLTANKGKIIFIMDASKDPSKLQIYDISNPSQMKLISTTEFPMESFFYIGILSRDEKTLFMLSKTLKIIDISNLHKPTVISTFEVNKNGDDFSPPWMVISKDEKTVYITCFDYRYYFLKIINISNLKSPSEHSHLNLPGRQNGYIFALSSDNKVVYMGEERGGFLAINVTKPAAPVIFGLVSQETLDEQARFFIAPDDLSIFVRTKSGFKIVSLQPQYTLYLPVDYFRIGGSYINPLAVLKYGDKEHYLPLKENFKLVQLSLYNVHIRPSDFETEFSYSSLPAWMHFDRDKGVLTIEPKVQSHIGSFNLHCVVSTQIPENVFEGLNNTMSKDESLELLLFLVGLGYVDNEKYLTPSFDISQPLLLSPQYVQLEEEIRSRLMKFYIQTITRVKVQTSLLLTQNDSLAIETFSTHSINVAIKLSPGKNESDQAQFVNRQYSAVLSTITDNKTKITLEGQKLDINHALDNLLVNLPYDNPCDGTITISDGVNPSIKRKIDNISGLLHLNTKPGINKKYSIQQQIDQVQVYTGEPFVIELLKSTFHDDYIEDLWIYLEMEDDSLVPGWISLQDLKISGTPPEKLPTKKIRFGLDIWNEFKWIKVPFTLTIWLSVMYTLKLMGTYTGYLMTVMGLWIYANKIYNICAKKYYRHPKKFIIRAGEEISDKTIFPIAFVKEELEQSKVILEQIEKELAERLGKAKVDKIEVAKALIDPNTGLLDKASISDLVEKKFSDIYLKTQKIKAQYVGAETTQTTFIKKLIFDELVKRQLESPEHKVTKSVFDKIKENWYDLLAGGENFEYVVKRSEVISHLAALGVEVEENDTEDCSIDDLIDSHALDSRMRLTITNDDVQLNSRSQIKQNRGKVRSLEKGLMESSVRGKKANLALLEQALCGHAFSFQYLNIEAIDIHVEAKQKGRDSYRLKRFLKMDLRPITFMDKGKIGYGILYQIKDDVLRFNGSPHSNVKGKTIVVQISNSKGKILLELWIYGFPSSSEKKSLVTDVDESL